MTTYNYRVGAQRPAYADQKQWMLRRYFDFTDTAAVASDVWTFSDVPALQLLKSAYAIRITAAGGACTADVKLVTGAQTLESNLDLNGTGYIVIDDVMPFFCVAADTLTLTLDHSNVAAKFWLCFEFIDFSDAANCLVNM